MEAQEKRIAAVLIAENSQKHLLLLNRKCEPLGWCLIGGHVDIIKESAAEAIIREAKEEVGADLTLDDIKYEGDSLSINGAIIKVFRCKKPINHVVLSKEHSGYAFVEKITPDLKMAGNTISFLKDHTFDADLADMDDMVPFGKYKDKAPIKAILIHDPQYILWLSENTQFKIRQRVLFRAAKLIRERNEMERNCYAEQDRIAAETRYRKEMLDTSVETPYGRAVYSNNGVYDLIDESGNRTGKVCNWYYGWSMGDGYDNDEAE